MLWKYDGRQRPRFADPPQAGQESVWDYPRPPAIAVDKRRITVRLDELVIAQSSRALKVMETASPPTLYLPPDDVRLECLVVGAGSSFCEWKGTAMYYDLEAPQCSLQQVGWCYPQPAPAFAALADHIAFYPGKLACFIDEERVLPQPGGFYGGWLTADIAGPVKGTAGTSGW